VTHSNAEILLGVLAAIAALAQLAHVIRVPAPVVLVVAGLLLGFVPGLPALELDPDVFFFLVLPLLLYSEAFLSSTEDLKAHAGEIFLLAVGLVVATAAIVAVVAHALTDLPWPSAFVLGAVVGPTDPIAATGVIRRLGVSGRFATILEGEALVNDGTALVLYRLAIGSAAAGAFSLGHALVEFAWVSLGGALTGAAVAGLVTGLRRWITVPEAEITLSLLIPFVAYLPAERLGVSGVLAAVTAGLLLGRRSHLSSAGTRLRRHAFWEVLAFLLDSTLFLVIGLAFPNVLARLGETATLDLVLEAVLLAAVVMVLRLAWMFLVPRLTLEWRTGERPRVGELFVLGWSGMRGGVSLAAALAVPVAAAGEPFPGRTQIIFFAYIVVLATLVLPGLTLGPLIDRLGVGVGRDQARADTKARAQILQAAIEHLEELARNDDLPEAVTDRLRELYASRREPAEALPAAPSPDEERVMLEARRGAIAAQRAALAELQEQQRIGTAAAREVARELDLEARLCA
jgi:Na+/H+ antiporter